MRAILESSGDLLADRRYLYGSECARQGDLGPACELFEQALERAPQWPAAWRALARARRDSGDLSGALSAFEECLRIDPADMLGAGLERARLKGLPAAAAPPAYIGALFDAYAEDFDDALSRLAYAAPEAVRRAVARSGRRFRRVLDLGCGTGLAGALLRDVADTLEGVDLSDRMLDIARKKGVYDSLRRASLLDFLGESGGPFDLIIAADVFAYIGDLAPVFRGLGARLAVDGLVAFTVEETGAADWALGDSLRFAHSECYLRRLADAAGLNIAIERLALRKDRGDDVGGLLAILSRPA